MFSVFKRYMKKILYSIIATFGLFSMVSCADMLETENDSMVYDPELDGKTDSVFYALGIAQAMQQLADQYFFIGEMRGELVSTTIDTDNNLRQLANFSANTTNKYDSAYVYYKVINNCNYYLTHRDTTNLFTGSTNVALNEYAAVAAWRAWAYLQLARTYGGAEQGIPFFTEPLTTIGQINGNVPTKTLSEIVNELAPMLERFSGYTVPTFGTTNYSIGSTNWGEAKNINPSKIFVPVDVILGDMYLETSQYLKAAQSYCKYLCDNKLIAEGYTVNRQFYDMQLSILETYPEDYDRNYNTNMDSYTSIFSNTASPKDVVSYIPMAVSSQKGKTTNIPLAFGYDYYSTDKERNCPRVDEIQIAPSKTFYGLTSNSAFYYYPKNASNSSLTNPDSVAVAYTGDGRACYSNGRMLMGNRDKAILNMDANDTTKIYISKAKNANIYLYRTTTIYLHLAEALNRMGYPDAAFAILRNGISTYLEELVPGAGEVYAEYQYINPETIDMLTNQVPFLNATNRNTFNHEEFEIFGIHHHGAGLINNLGIENNVTVKGSEATAVGSKFNIHYLPKPIIGAKMAEIAAQFDVQVGATKEDSINAMEDLLCDEYAKEFAFEGRRFYDLQRIARHKNESAIYGGNFGSKWFAKKLEGNNPTVSLLEPKNWYLPLK